MYLLFFKVQKLQKILACYYDTKEKRWGETKYACGRRERKYIEVNGKDAILTTQSALFTI